jgi:HAD superfamily hydrolase (TIGR01509 family)
MKLKAPLEGILFDFDGLILETETPIFQAWQEKFQEYGQDLSLEEWSVILGKSKEHLGPIEEFLSSFAEQEIREKIVKDVSARELSLINDQQPLPGAVELIRKSHQKGLRLGIVSSSDRIWVHAHLSRLGLLEYFNHTSCADDVQEAKPDPALYHLGLQKLGCTPDKVLVLEDSPTGVLAAKRAGLYCIAVPNPLTRQLQFNLNGGAPDLVLNSLVEFPWKEFMKEG